MANRKASGTGPARPRRDDAVVEPADNELPGLNHKEVILEAIDPISLAPALDKIAALAEAVEILRNAVPLTQNPSAAFRDCMNAARGR